MFKIFLNVKEVLEKNKPIPFISCKAKFHQMIKTSLIPFKQTMIFRVQQQESNQPIDLLFEKNLKELGETTIEIKNEFLMNSFEFERLYPIERTDSQVKTYAKIFISVLDCSQDNVSSIYKAPLERRSETNSPILFSKNKKKKFEQTKPINIKNSDYEYEMVLPERNIARKESAISLRTFEKQSFFKQPEKFKLNFQELKKEHQSSEIIKESIQSAQTKKYIKKSQDPMTSRLMEKDPKPPQFRKTRSLERLKKMQPKQHSNFYVLKDPGLNYNDNTFAYGIVDSEHHKETKISASKEREGIKKKAELNKNDFEIILKEGNDRLLKENQKLERLILTIKELRGRYENEYGKQNEQIELYSDRCVDLEKSLYLIQNELLMWKSKAEIIDLLEKEVENLRLRLDEQEKQSHDTQRIFILKTQELQELIRKLENEKKKYQEEIKHLEEENENLRIVNMNLIQKTNGTIFDNHVLKAKIASFEINAELVKCLTSEKESFSKEVNGLRMANKDLKEKLKSLTLNIHRDEETNFGEDIERLKKRLFFINHLTISSFQDMNNYLNINHNLQNNLELLDSDSSHEELDNQSKNLHLIPKKHENKGAKGLSEQVNKNLDNIITFETNNQLLEKCLHSPISYRKKSISSAKKHQRETHSSTNSLSISQVSPQNKKTQQKKNSERRKLSYTPIQEDYIDTKLSSYINNHIDSKRLFHLFKKNKTG